MSDDRQLAILGGSARFAEPLHVGRPNVGDIEAFISRSRDMLERRWVTNNGPYVIELEQRLAEHLGVRNAVAMCNGTIALEIAIRACDLTGEVILPSFTFVGTAHALQWQQITPVFCDVDPATHLIDPTRVEQLITPRTTGILGVHLWGRGCDVEALQKIADRHSLTLLFDAAHAFSCETNGHRIGRFGRAEVFSFHGTKFFNTLEGGAVATDDDDLATQMRFMRNFGFAGYDRVDHVGTNGKMTESSAAMGLVNLDSLDDFVAVNQANYAAYREGLDLPGVRLLDPELRGASNWQYVVLEIDADVFGVSRDRLVETLWAENVQARRYFHPGAHRMEPYRSFYPNAGLLLPVTEGLTQSVLVLPTGTAVSVSDVAEICSIIRAAHDEALALNALVQT